MYIQTSLCGYICTRFDLFVCSVFFWIARSYRVASCYLSHPIRCKSVGNTSSVPPSESQHCLQNPLLISGFCWFVLIFLIFIFLNYHLQYLFGSRQTRIITEGKESSRIRGAHSLRFYLLVKYTFGEGNEDKRLTSWSFSGRLVRYGKKNKFLVITNTHNMISLGQCSTEGLSRGESQLWTTRKWKQ